MSEMTLRILTWMTEKMLIGFTRMGNSREVAGRGKKKCQFPFQTYGIWSICGPQSWWSEERAGPRVLIGRVNIKVESIERDVISQEENIERK